jgi:hypothetical protein
MTRISNKELAASMAMARKPDDTLMGRGEIGKSERAISMWATGKSIDKILDYLFGLPSEADIAEMAKREQRNAPPSSHSQSNAYPSEVFRLRRKSALRWLAKLGITE